MLILYCDDFELVSFLDVKSYIVINYKVVQKLLRGSKKQPCETALTFESLNIDDKCKKWWEDHAAKHDCQEFVQLYSYLVSNPIFENDCTVEDEDGEEEKQDEDENREEAKDVSPWVRLFRDDIVKNINFPMLYDSYMAHFV